jgi:hypothetical protein
MLVCGSRHRQLNPQPFYPTEPLLIPLLMIHNNTNNSSIPTLSSILTKTLYVINIPHFFYKNNLDEPKARSYNI